MVEIVVHLLLIHEHFFVPNLYVSGNGNDFSGTLESNIWDYVMYSRAELSAEACGILSRAAVTYPQRSHKDKTNISCKNLIFA